MKNKQKTTKLVGIATLLTLIVVLQLLSNYIQIGSVSITLALVPMVIGGIIYGPLTGMLLGFAMGLLAIVAPATIAFFWPVNPTATVLICLIKGALSGFIPALLYKALRFWSKKLSVIIASVLTPIINTGIFLVGAAIFFKSVYGATNTLSAFSVIMGGILVNFTIEFAVNVVLSTTVYSLVVMGEDKLNINITVNSTPQEDSKPDFEIVDATLDDKE